MSKSKHTPGPWYCEPSDTKHAFPARQQVFGDGHLLAEVAGNGKGGSGANARLIAAAPDLLAALMRLIDHCPYLVSADECECGENGDGSVCEHTQAARAVERALGNIP